MSSKRHVVRRRALRDRLTAMLAAVGVLVMSLGLVVVTATGASAHTPKFSADCSGVTAEGTSYEAKDTNTITVTLDGGAPQTKTFDVNGSLTVAVPQDGESHTWTASVISSNSNPSYSKSASGTVGPCGTKTKITAPDPKLTPPTCDKDGSVEWTSFANGTWTGITGTGVGTQSATPVANAGYELANPGKVTVQVLGKSDLDCRTIVTPAAPKVVDSVTCEVPGSVTVTPVNGVKYTWVKGSAGMTEGDYEIKATPEDGFKFDGAQEKVYTGTLAPAKDCATPVTPKVNLSVECDVEGTWSVDTTPGLSYRLTSGGTTTTIDEGKTYTGPAKGVITAVADAGYALVDASWKYDLDVPAAAACPEVKPIAPSVVQSAECDVPSTIKLTEVLGVKYTWVTGQEGMTEGLYEIVATPEKGYKFAGDQSVTYEGELDAMDVCVEPTAPEVLQSMACDVPGGVKVVATEGVKYEWVEGNAQMTEGHFIIEATPETGYAFKGAEQVKTFTGDLAPAEKCATPAVPVVVASDECNVPGSVSTVPAEGVLYTWELGAADMTEGPYRIVATPETGYAFQGADQSVTYEGTLDPAEECVKPTPTVKGTESIKPKPEPHTQPTVKGVEQIVPTAVDAGFTGGDAGTPANLAALMGQLLVAGGLMLLAAAGWTGFGRRERGSYQA